MTRPVVDRVAVTMTVLVVVLSAANWYDRPDRAAAWAAAMLVLPVGWGLAALASRRSSRIDHERASRRAQGAISGAIIVAGLMLLAGLTESLLGPDGPFTGLGQRMTMILLGAYLVFTGNTMPKMLVSLSSLQCDGSRTQAFLRTAGWIWVLSGLALASAWALLPVGIARVVTVAVALGSTIVVGARAYGLRGTRRREA